MENEFYKDYKERVMPALQQQHGYKNVHQVPKVEKVVINTSVGSQADVKQALEKLVHAFTPQCHLRADRLVLPQLEIRNAFLRSSLRRALTGD